MYRMTARNIAVISPMRQSFHALTKAGAFAAAVMEKYSGTEAFPFGAETLVYLNALNKQLEDEKRLRSEIGYTLKLMIVRRLILEGKVKDPTVTGHFLSAVSERIERSMSFIRVSDSNAYTRITEALSYINSPGALENALSVSEITEDKRSYRYSSVDLTSLTQRFFGEQSASYAYSGRYAYNTLPGLVFSKEDISGDSVNVREPSEDVTSVINAGDTSYNYSTENLTYRTESESPEVSGETVNIRNEQKTYETAVNSGSGVTNVAVNTQETVVNTGGTSYSYNTEILTYRAESETPEASERAGETETRPAVKPADISREELKTVRELERIGLPVLNTFLSGGAEYLASVRERYIHRRISLIPVTAPVGGTNSAFGLLNSPEKSLRVLSYAVELLTSGNEQTPY
ncbi:MAG: hypothetical protein IK093_19195, partial [Ruminiclostridium sp.]|nr:hypothetical protein [Ruminiclostridium sp.]